MRSRFVNLETDTMRNLRFPRFLSTVTAPAALILALGLVITSCAQQSESPVAPSGARGGTLNTDTVPTPTPTPTVEPTPTPTPNPTPTPVPGIPCSPGYWKNHLSDFNAHCGAAAAIGGDAFNSCGDLLEALTCRGSDASCGRSAAAAALNTVSQCTE